MKGDRELCMAAVARMEGIKGDRELYTAAVAQDWKLSSSSVRRCRGAVIYARQRLPRTGSPSSSSARIKMGDRELCLCCHA